jgi:outer membrane immunogenic protein
MRKFLLANLVLVAAVWSGAGLAADMPVKAAPKAVPIDQTWNWSGFYVGGHFGYGWAYPDITEDTFGTKVVNPPRPDGILGGAQLGYNFQFGHWVLGLEGDYTWSDIKGSSNSVSPAGILNAQGLPDTLSTITGRVGYAAGRLLYYAKGGAAWMNENFKQLSVTTPNCVGTPCTGSNATWGWAIGGGAEYAFDPHWSARLEYIYLDFPTNEAVTTSNGASVNRFHLTRTFDLIKFGVNYKFGG